jgi:hypothetical protein
MAKIEAGREYVGPVGASRSVRVLVLGFYEDGDIEIRVLERHQDVNGRWRKAGTEYSFDTRFARRNWKLAPQKPAPPKPRARARPKTPPPASLFPATTPVLPPTLIPAPPPLAKIQEEALRQGRAGPPVMPPPPPLPDPLVRVVPRPATGPLFGGRQEKVRIPAPTIPPASPPITGADLPGMVRRVSERARTKAVKVMRAMKMPPRQAEALSRSAVRRIREKGMKIGPGETESAELTRLMLQMHGESLPSSIVQRPVVPKAPPAPPPPLPRPAPPTPPAAAPRAGETWIVNDAGVEYAVRVAGVGRGGIEAQILGGAGARGILPAFLFVRRAEGLPSTDLF